MDELIIQTRKKREVVDITQKLSALLKNRKADGLVHLFLTHTTAALTTADLDPGTDQDMLDVFEVLIPKLNFRHSHDPSHAPDHILSSLIGISLALPVKEGELVLGIWQRVVLIEFDGPRERKIIIAI